MKKLITLLPFLVWMFPPCSLAEPPGREERTVRLDLTEATAQVEELLRGWDRPDAPGGAIGVARDGRVLLTRAYGLADLEHSVPNTPSTIFEAGSVSKQFVAAAIVLLALEGRLSLDDDVREFIPELPDYGSTITLHRLMTHTSGLRDWGHVATIAGLGRESRSHNHDHVIDILSRQQRLNFPPGERYSYNNSGYNLLAIVVDRVADQPFAEFSKQRIFQPIGMTATQWRDDYRRVVPGRAAAYSGREGGNRYTLNRPIEDVHGNGGLLTTVGDLLKWNHALATDFFGEKFTQMMHRRGVLNSGRTIDYAGGLRMVEDHGQPVINHSGSTAGYRAHLAYYPKEQLSVVVLFNVTGVNAAGLSSRIAGFFLNAASAEDRREREAPGPPFEISAESLRSRAGLYVDPRNHRVTELAVNGGRLMLGNSEALIPVSDREFRSRGGRSFRFVDSVAGGASSLQVLIDGFEEELLAPVNGPAPMNGERLAAYAGRFESPDAGVTLGIAVRDGALVATRGFNDEARLEPLYEDAFDAGPLGLIRFFRDDAGNVVEFACSRPRVYDLRFYRR